MMKLLGLVVVLCLGLVYGGPVGLDSNSTTRGDKSQAASSQSSSQDDAAKPSADAEAKDFSTGQKGINQGGPRDLFGFRSMNQPFQANAQGADFQNTLGGGGGSFNDFNKGMFSGGFSQFGGSQGLPQQQQQQQSIPFMQQATASPFGASGFQNFQQGGFNFRQQQMPTAGAFNAQGSSMFGMPMGQQFAQQQPLNQQFLSQQQQDPSNADRSVGQQSDGSQQQQLPFNFFGFNQQFPNKREVPPATVNATTDSSKKPSSGAQSSSDSPLGGPFFGGSGPNNPMRPGSLMPPMGHQFPHGGLTFPWDLQFGQDFNGPRNMMFIPVFFNPGAMFPQPHPFEFHPTVGPIDFFQGGQRPKPGQQQPMLPSLGQGRQDSLRNFDVTTVKN